MDSDDSKVSLKRQAINAALSYNWEEAVLLNKQIMKEFPEDTDCLNRLARAFFELGKYPQAKKVYQDVLRIDPYNSIAQKNLKRVSSFKKASANGKINGHAEKDPSFSKIMLSPSLFVEEPGITAVINLVKLAEPQKLSLLSPGLLVNLTLKNRHICATDMDDNYLGSLPDDMSHRLLKLISGGNKYQALIKSVKPNALSIIVRETFRSRKFKNQPSFVSDHKAVTYSSDHISLMDDSDEVSPDVQESDESLL